MSNPMLWDYDDVSIVANEATIDPHHVQTDELHTGLIIGDLLSSSRKRLRSELPFVFYHDSLPGDDRLQKICSKLGVMSAGPVGSTFVLSNLCDSTENVLGVMAEFYNPIAPESIAEITRARGESQAPVLVGCAFSAAQARALVNEKKIGDAILVGVTQSTIARTIEATGLTTPRVSLISELSRTTSVPIVATVANSSEVCKAFAAGASGVLLHIGGPFDENYTEDVLEKLVTDVIQSLDTNVRNLMNLVGARSIKDISFRCRLLSR